MKIGQEHIGKKVRYQGTTFEVLYVGKKAALGRFKTGYSACPGDDGYDEAFLPLSNKFELIEEEKRPSERIRAMTIWPFTVMKRRKFEKELQERREAERHLNAGGCFSCWSLRDHLEYKERNPRAYMAMMFLLWTGPVCPRLRTSKATEELIAELE